MLQRSTGKIFFITFLLVVNLSSYSQPDHDIVSIEKMRQALSFLASDSMNGRASGSYELFKAAQFIGEEFHSYGLKPVPGLPSYYLPFRISSDENNNVKDLLVWNKQDWRQEHFLFFQSGIGPYSDKALSDFKVLKTDSCFSEDILQRFGEDSVNILIWASAFQPGGNNIFPNRFEPPVNGLKNNILLVFSDMPPETLSLSAQKDYFSDVAYNVVSVLPGKSKPSEIVLFSAHYDHVGYSGKGARSGIKNGANDNASGVVAVLELARYFAKRNDNERTIMFCAFAGEELGMLGSTNFADLIHPTNIVAMINIEMIGIPQYGKGAIFFTGEQQSGLPSILREDLKGVHVIADPSPKSQLFSRSDNYPFALLGVPAHTIMSSDDNDRCYHSNCDDVGRINFQHMKEIIESVAEASNKLVKGEATPSRISRSKLK